MKVDYLNRSYTFVPKAMQDLLDFLSDLEKEEKPMELDFEQELYKHFGQVKDFTLGMRIGQYFYELGRQSKQTEWTEKDEKMFMDAWWHISYSVSNGASTDDDNGITRWLKDIRNRIQQSKPKVSEELETEALRSAGVLLSEHFEDEDDDAIRTTALRCWKGGVIHGASWQKEQMIKGAIDAEFCSAGMFMPMIDFKDKRMEGIKYGDTIKVIVIKEK